MGPDLHENKYVHNLGFPSLKLLLEAFWALSPVRTLSEHFGLAASNDFLIFDFITKLVHAWIEIVITG